MCLPLAMTEVCCAGIDFSSNGPFELFRKATKSPKLSIMLPSKRPNHRLSSVLIICLMVGLAGPANAHVPSKLRAKLAGEPRIIRDNGVWVAKGKVRVRATNSAFRCCGGATVQRITVACFVRLHTEGHGWLDERMVSTSFSRGGSSVKYPRYELYAGTRPHHVHLVHCHISSRA